MTAAQPHVTFQVQATWPDGSVLEFAFAYPHIWGWVRTVEGMYARCRALSNRDPLEATWEVIPELPNIVLIEGKV